MERLENKMNLNGSDTLDSKEEQPSAKVSESALTDVAQWIEGWPMSQRIAGLTPSQGTFLGCIRGNHPLLFLFFSFFLPSSL